MLTKGQRMQENADKMALIEEIEKLIESDPNAPISSFSMLEFLEVEDLVSVRETLLRSKTIALLRMKNGLMSCVKNS